MFFSSIIAINAKCLTTDLTIILDDRTPTGKLENDEAEGGVETKVLRPIEVEYKNWKPKD